MAETARENQVNSAAVKYETVADMGSGLVIAKVKLTDFREQDINARIMKTEMQKQLTDNIKKRGQLESLPFCALIDGKIEIISGHHRIRSAKDSGVLTELFVILDTTGLRRSQVAAKQLAHNAISGFDDQSTLKEIAKMIDDVDDMLESYIGKDIIGEPMAELEKLLSPKVEFDWKNVTFTFLPHQLRDLDQLVKVLGSLSPDMLGVADIDQHEEFIETITKYQQFANVKNTGAAIHAMIKASPCSMTCTLMRVRNGCSCLICSALRPSPKRLLIPSRRRSTRWSRRARSARRTSGRPLNTGLLIIWQGSR